MSDQVGSIYYESSISTKQLKKDSAEADAIAKRTGDNLGVEMERGESRASAALSKLAAVAKVTAIATGVALVGGLTAAAKASFEQVGAVQQATGGLKAYEKDASKVDDVLKSLVSYARSDMGVLFNRKDLFQSAQMLKLNGVETENLTDNVKILSRSVGLGLGNWQDLNSVVGRVVSTGRLSGIEFDQLTQYGYKLDKSLRNTNISATDLFKALDKGIPVDAMAGQANTIQGIGIRLQTAFRGIGDAILGVDSDTGEFIENGLGDKLINGLGTATTALKKFKPVIAEFSTNFTEGIGNVIDKFKEWWPTIKTTATQVYDYLAPSFKKLKDSVMGILPTLTRLWEEVVVPLAKAFGTTLVAGIKGVLELFSGFIGIAGPVLTWMLDNKWIVLALAAAFVAIKTAMLISDTFTAYQQGLGNIAASATVANGAIGGASGQVRGLQGLLQNPISLNVAVAGALAAIALAQAAADKFWQTMKNAYDTTVGTIRKAAEAEVAGKKAALTAAQASGKKDLTQEVRDLYISEESNRNFTKRASGGPVSAGRPYIVGDNPDGSLNKTSELFVPRSAGRIVSSDDLQNAMGKGGSSNVTNISLNLTGIMSRSRSDQREIAKDLVRSINEELVSQGKPAIGGIQ